MNRFTDLMYTDFDASYKAAELNLIDKVARLELLLVDAKYMLLDIPFNNDATALAARIDEELEDMK